MEKQVIDCACHSSEHIILFTKDSDFEDNYKCVYMHYFLQDTVWYKRVWLGIKYIFGFKSRYGHFGEFIIDENNIDKFKEIVEFISPNEYQIPCQIIDTNE